METAYIDKNELREYLAKELPVIIEENLNIQKTIFLISKKNFADRDKMFEELQKDREENNKKWEEANKRFARFDERFARFDERFEAILQEIKDIRNRQESSVGALGARWGIAAESSFRNALKAILENRFDVQVLNVTEYDHEGFVFGQPDQVESDVIIKNGEIIVCEIKSSVSRSDVYTFHRKVQFYEKQHHCKVTAMMVISPMVDKYAQAVAKKLGIEVYSYSEDVRL